MKRILCPVDFSELSRSAVGYAAALARQLGAEVTVLHVQPGAPGDGGAQARLEELARGEGLRTAVAAGDPSTVILEQSESLRADLIVMGTHGRRGFDRWLLGSVTERVLHRAPCPVLTVNNRAEPPAADGPPFRTILCAEDFAPSSQELAAALALAPAGSRLLVLHAVEELPDDCVLGAVPFEYGPLLISQARERLQAALSAVAADRAAEAIVVPGRAYRQILALAEAEKADLVVVGVNSGERINHMFFGSTTHHVVRGAACPVLTVRGRLEETKHEA
ncbi:MAG TPA: universal stress protein [Thermoanaerobaculia bacterium]|jgi:nucleotide-binding universal stress UspA family protein|nr:universal stress protein [Thermoanaerobaculia bacterium]